MAGARKSARMSERRQLEEEDEERKREDDRKRQRTLFQRKDNIIRKNDMIVDTKLGKIAVVPEEGPEDVKVKAEANDEEEMGQMIQSEFSDGEREDAIVISDVRQVKLVKDNHQQTDDNFGTGISDSRDNEVKQEVNAPEDVKVKVETNDAEENIRQLNHSVFCDEERGVVFVTHEVHMPTTTGHVKEDPEAICQQTEDNNGTPISDSSAVEVNQFEAAQLISWKLEMEGMKQLVKEQDQKIGQLATELKSVHSEMESEKQKTSQRFEEYEEMTKAELEVCKAENRRLEAIVLQIRGKVELVEMKREGESNSSREEDETVQLEKPSPVISSESEANPEGSVAYPSESNSTSGNVANTEIEGFPDVKTPMIIDPGLEAVLSRILKHIDKDFQTLKSFRLVSRAWHQVSLPTWRSTAVVKLLPDLGPSSPGGIETSNFLQEYRNHQSPYKLVDKPYSQYKLADFLIYECEGWNELWDLIGPLMEYVHFQDCLLANTTSNDFPKLLIEKLPKLKELALTSVKYNKVEEEDSKMPLLDRNHLQLQSLRVNGQIEIHLERLLVSLPSLTSILVFNEAEKIILDDTLEKICLAKRLKPTSLPNLKQLNFMNTLTQLNTTEDVRVFPRKLQRLVRANLQLESLAISLIPVRHLGETNIDPFLVSQAATLRVLKVYRAPVACPFESFLCQTPMTTLKELHLWGAIVPGLDFLKYTPNLKVLYVNLTCFEKRRNVKQVVNELFTDEEYSLYEENMVDTVEHLMEGVAVKSLETLYIDYEFPERSLRTLAKWVPNLKVLKTIVTWNNVSAVVEEWSELKELTCLFESKVRDWTISKDDTKSRRKRGAVISDLKKLEHFQLDCLCDGSQLTDDSVFHGFLKMPSLKSVQICVSKQFSDEAEEALKRGVKNCCVIRNYTGGDHSNYDCCQRREFNLEVATTGLRIEDEDESVKDGGGEMDTDVDKT